MRCQCHCLWLVSLAICPFMAASAQAQVGTGFEPPAYNGSAAGTLLTGQQGWYNPVAGSADVNVFTYPGNALGLPVNPTGGSQFIGATGPGTVFARTQLDNNFTLASLWTASYDVVHRYSGTLPAAQNLSSFSTQPSTTTRGFIALHVWSDINTATNWNATFNVFDAAGTATNGLSPGAAWSNLAVDNWYRESVTFDLLSNQVTAVSLTDLTTNVTNTFNPTGWFLLGGSTGGGFPAPTSVRFFAGSLTAGNVAGWDNLSVQPVPEPSSTILMVCGAAAMFGRRFRRR